MREPAMLQIDVLLTEDELAGQLLSALEERHLPEKFFYWSPLSVRAWLALCRDSQPYRNYARSYELVSEHADDIASRCAPAALEVVSLGAGQADKDLLLLEALRVRGSAPRYRPLDASQALLEMACRRASDAGFAVRALKADLESPDTARALADSACVPRLYLLLGNTLGAVDPPRFLERLRGLLRREDRLLVDGEIFSASGSLPEYDNRLNRRFAFAPLESLGLEEGRDGALVFESEADPRHEGLHRVAKHFRAARRLRIQTPGGAVELAPGEKLRMSASCKYSRPAFLGLLGRGRLRLLAEYPSADGRFLMVDAAPETP